MVVSADFVCPRSDEEAWLAARRTGIGSSDAPVLVLGRAYGRTPLDLFMEKVGTVTARRDESEAMKWGAALENAVLIQLCNEAKLYHSQATLEGTWRNRERPYLVATPDAWVVPGLDNSEWDRTVAELKAFGTLDGWEEGVPDYPRIQAQHQMAVLGLPFCYVAALGGGYGGMRFLWARVERDEEFINGVLLPKCEAFWACVVAKEPPPPGPDDAAALAKLAGEPEVGKVVQLPATFMEMADDLQEHDNEVEFHDLAASEIRNKIKAAMGDATEAMLPDGRGFSWRPNAKGVRQFRRIGT